MDITLDIIPVTVGSAVAWTYNASCFEPLTATTTWLMELTASVHSRKASPEFS